MVSLFGKKKKEEEKKPEKTTRQRPYRELSYPTMSKKVPIGSREFKLFKERDKKRLTWFEFLAKMSGKVLSVNPPDEATKKELESGIAFTSMRITPKDVMALFVLTLMAFIIASVITVALGILPLIGIVFVSAGGLGLGYYFLKYPKNLMKAYRMQASSQVVLAILYMVVSMRVTPNLEQALKFSAANVTGPLAWDMRRILWDIQMGKYYSASHAMGDYIAKWKPENEEFAESLRLIRDSQTHSSSKSEIILDEALDVILDGTKTRMKHYAQELALPVSVIHMMGIVLPILGSVMAPMAAVFLSDM
ncbi:MAG: type II secretion system F family protein, partial [Candidatus Aenigmarchaeota archaeon]|nr:type II secretion system F family protein [Candidatus Aenigmarchaeota archaeon]